MFLFVCVCIFLCLLIIYYILYKCIEINDTLYWGPGCYAPVKVIDKNIFTVTLSNINEIFTINTIDFLLLYKKNDF